MKTKSSIFLLILVITSSLHAKKVKEEPCETSGDVTSHATGMLKVMSRLPANDGCADKAKLEKICLDVLSKSSAPDESPFQYSYEMKLHAAACANPEIENEEAVNRKIRAMWKRLENDLICNTTDFDVPRGSILKYAVKMRAFDLVSQAAESWKVNLNRVDEADGRTLLDYVRSEIEKNKGTNLEPVLKGYYKVLQRSGAKHKAELSI